MSSSSEYRTEGNGNRQPSPTRRQSEPQRLSSISHLFFLSQINVLLFFFLLRLVCLFLALSLALIQTIPIVPGRLRGADGHASFLLLVLLYNHTSAPGGRSCRDPRRMLRCNEEMYPSRGTSLKIYHYRSVFSNSFFLILFLPHDIFRRL